MKLFFASIALVAVIASPVLAQSTAQPVSKPPVVAQAVATPAKVAVRLTKKTNKTMVKGHAGPCEKVSENVIADGVFIGCDPDLNVREEMIKEYNEGS